MRQTFLIIGFLFSLFSSCQSEKKVGQEQKYLRWVGDIEQDGQIDDDDFRICNSENEVFQYFNLGNGPVYSGEKPVVLESFQANYKVVSDTSQNGLIRIRFVVNCQGKAGRFRVIQSDYNYQKKEFPQEIIDQLLNITKGIEDWAILYKEEQAVDYYMYLVFKIEAGQIIEILP